MIYSNSHTHIYYLIFPSHCLLCWSQLQNVVGIPRLSKNEQFSQFLTLQKKQTNQLLFFILISDKYLKYLHLFEKNSVNNIRLRLPMNFMSILFKCSCWLLLKQWAVFLRPRDLLFSFSPKISRKNNEFSAYKNPFVVTQRFYPHWFFAW